MLKLDRAVRRSGARQRMTGETHCRVLVLSNVFVACFVFSCFTFQGVFTTLISTEMSHYQNYWSGKISFKLKGVGEGGGNKDSTRITLSSSSFFFLSFFHLLPCVCVCVCVCKRER